MIRNVIESVPGTSTTFVYFALPGKNTTWKEKPDDSSHITEQALLASIELLRNRIHVGQARVAHDVKLDPAWQNGTSDLASDVVDRLQMWSNVQQCWEMVKEHERKVGQQFDYVTRLRPDAVFFDRWELPPMDGSTIIVPKGGLGCSSCANDHMAVVPRPLAELYFSDIADRYRSCDSGLCVQIHRTGYAGDTSKGNPPHHGGAGYVYHDVGLNFSGVPVPYAVTYHPTAGAMHTPPLLQCNRLGDHTDLCHHIPYETPTYCHVLFQNSAWHMTRACQGWRCSAWSPKSQIYE